MDFWHQQISAAAAAAAAAVMASSSGPSSSPPSSRCGTETAQSQLSLAAALLHLQMQQQPDPGHPSPNSMFMAALLAAQQQQQQTSARKMLHDDESRASKSDLSESAPVKRPLLKFSMDAILSESGVTNHSSPKKLCTGIHLTFIRRNRSKRSYCVISDKRDPNGSRAPSSMSTATEPPPSYRVHLNLNGPSHKGSKIAPSNPLVGEPNHHPNQQPQQPPQHHSYSINIGRLPFTFKAGRRYSRVVGAETYLFRELRAWLRARLK